MAYMSPVMCHLSGVTCNLFKFVYKKIKNYSVVELVGGGTVINEAYLVKF